MFANRQGLGALLKDGHKTFTGIDEVTSRNIEACKTLTDITRTSLGPYALSKLVVTSIGRRYVTTDTSAIVKELEVQHPAAKILSMAVEMQKQEVGEGCNLLLVLAGQLLTEADYLLRQGLHLSDVIRGYEMALEVLPGMLDECCVEPPWDLRCRRMMTTILRPVLATRPLVTDAKLASLVASAVTSVMPQDCKNFDPENIRVAKLQGGCLSQSSVVNGIVVTRTPTGVVEKKENCKVMVLGCGLECATTEAKGTVLLHSAQELKTFTRGEEAQMEETIRNIRDAGVEAIVVHGGGISDVAQHYCDKYDILTLKIQSKFEARRICKALGAAAMVRMGVPLADELGIADSISVVEVACKRVTQILCRDTRVQTIVLRGSTPCLLDEAERAVQSACAFTKALTKDPRVVYGAGAVEIEIARKLQGMAEKLVGVEQYAVMKAAEAFEAVPRILAETAGLNATEALASLHALHAQGRHGEGVNVDAIGSTDRERLSNTIDVKDSQVYDHLFTKLWAIRLAWDAAITVLRVDQIIMARPAGGPAPRAPGAPDLD